MQFLHGFNGIGADARVGVVGGGFEKFLEPRVLEAADEFDGHGGDARIAVPAEGDDLVAVLRKVGEGHDHFEGLGNLGHRALKLDAELLGEDRIGGDGAGGGVLDRRRHALIVVPDLVKAAADGRRGLPAGIGGRGLGFARGAMGGEEPADGCVRAGRERRSWPRSRHNRASGGSKDSGRHNARRGSLGSRTRFASTMAASGSRGLGDGAGDADFPGDGIRRRGRSRFPEGGSTRRGRSGGLQADKLDKAKPRGPGFGVPGEFLTQGGEEFKVGDGLGGLAEDGVDEAEGLGSQCRGHGGGFHDARGRRRRRV